MRKTTQNIIFKGQYVKNESSAERNNIYVSWIMKNAEQKQIQITEKHII